jgi:hypothetical protein
MREIDDFLNSWAVDGSEETDEWQSKVKAVFTDFYNLFKHHKLQMTWHARPGKCYSLDVFAQGATSGFARLDIVDDDPEERWLFLCIKKDLAEDPENYGEVMPEILDGQDALCFDIDERDDVMRAYLQTLLENAVRKLS